MASGVYAYHRVRDPSAHEKKHPACAYPVDSVPGRSQHIATSLARTRATHLHSLRNPTTSTHHRIGELEPETRNMGSVVQRSALAAAGCVMLTAAVDGLTRSVGVVLLVKSTVGTAATTTTLV